MLASTVAHTNERIGSAIRLGVFENQSPEWHAIRATGIGGSDVGAITNLSKWESPLSLWAKKTERIDGTLEQSEPMYWGTTLEPVIMAEFVKRHPELDVVASPGTYCHVDRPWQIANPDGIFWHVPITRSGDDQFFGAPQYGIVEIKTARYEDEWDEKTNTVPATYRAQVQWYLQTFGFHRAIVAVLFSGSKYAEFEILADEFEQDANLARVEAWREYVLADRMPDFDGAEATYEAVRAMHPDIDDTLEVELGNVGHEYLTALQQFEVHEANLREAKSRVIDAMGTAKRGTYQGNLIVTRQAKKGGAPYLVNKKG